MVKIVFVTLTIILVIAASLIIDFQNANIDAKENYSNAYNLCLQDLDKQKNFFQNISENDTRVIRFNSCTAKGGCYPSCGNGCAFKPSLSFFEYVDNIFCNFGARLAMCIDICLMPPESFAGTNI